METLLEENSANQSLFSLSDLAEFDDSTFFAEKVNHSLVEKYFVFTIENDLYAVNSKNVAEVLNPLPIAALPNVPKWLCGVMNLRGEIISVIDLRKFWNKKTSAPTKPKLIVLKSEKHSVEAAFVVDRLHEPVSLVPSDIKFSAADYVDSFPTLFGKATDNGNTLLLIDVEKLLASLNVIYSQ